MTINIRQHAQLMFSLLDYADTGIGDRLEQGLHQRDQRARLLPKCFTLLSVHSFLYPYPWHSPSVTRIFVKFNLPVTEFLYTSKKMQCFVTTADDTMR